MYKARSKTSWLLQSWEKTKLLRSYIASFRRNEKKKNFIVLQPLHFWGAMKSGSTLHIRRKGRSPKWRKENVKLFNFCCPALKYVISSFLCYVDGITWKAWALRWGLLCLNPVWITSQNWKFVEKILASLSTSSPSIKMAKLRAQHSQSCL